MRQEKRQGPDSFDSLLNAVLQDRDESACKAMREYLRIRAAGRTPIVERHPQEGWRVRDSNDEGSQLSS